MADNLGDEHPRLQGMRRVDLDPIPIALLGALGIAEEACGHLQRHKGDARAIALILGRPNDLEGESRCVVLLFLSRRKPRPIVTNCRAEFVRPEVPGQPPEMSHHGTFIGQVADGDLDDVEAVVPKPASDLAVTFGGRLVAVQVAAQAVQIETDPFVLIVMISSVNDIRSRCADRSVQAELLSSRALLKSRGDQEMSQTALHFVDRMRALAGLL